MPVRDGSAIFHGQWYQRLLIGKVVIDLSFELSHQGESH